jgi:hypothetical protein
LFYKVRFKMQYIHIVLYCFGIIKLIGIVVIIFIGDGKGVNLLSVSLQHLDELELQ